MEKISYPTFEPKKPSSGISNNIIVILSWLIGLFFMWGLDEILETNTFYNLLRSAYLIFLFCISVYWAITAFWHYQSLNGEFSGYIEFHNDYFKINKKTFELKDIINIEVSLGDYYGQQLGSMQLDFNPRLSQGVNNYIEFKSLDNTIYRTYFKQTVKNQHKELYPFIRKIIQLGKMPFLRGIVLLEITDYDEIQEFKKQLTQT